MFVLHLGQGMLHREYSQVSFPFFYTTFILQMRTMRFREGKLLAQICSANRTELVLAFQVKWPHSLSLLPHIYHFSWVLSRPNVFLLFLFLGPLNLNLFSVLGIWALSFTQSINTLPSDQGQLYQLRDPLFNLDCILESVEKLYRSARCGHIWQMKSELWR